MRLGVFGGTFDPVHYGHLLLAERCRKECRLDEVWFVPAGTPPHKLNVSVTPASARAEMLELAIAGHPAFRVDRRELLRKEPCFTVETLEELAAEDPARELWFLMGGDSLADFPGWKAPRRILELARLAVAKRGSRPSASLEDLRRQFGGVIAERVQVVTMPVVDFSSSDVRERVRRGASIRYMVPRAVEGYIEAQRIYESRPSAPPTQREGAD